MPESYHTVLPWSALDQSLSQVRAPCRFVCLSKGSLQTDNPENSTAALVLDKSKAVMEKGRERRNDWKRKDTMG